MYEHHEVLEGKVMIGVGAAFDFHTGRVRQAPRWMMNSGLEWLFRLAVEPRRLAPRYIRNNPSFLWHIVLQSLGVRRYTSSEES
jgi:N-acetylglucosaminyldiphosphoundecaprenol N-acetyl-beta-D-mannosaminyltransferase